MDPLPLSKVVEVVRGRWRGAGPPGEEPVLEVSTDSRTAAPGSLFVPLPGKHFDGRQFIGEALSRGARASFVWGAGAEAAPALTGLPEAGLIEVDDPYLALERLAAYWREAVNAQTIAVTGTVGKTTTKEFLGLLLATRFPTVRAPRSFNNRLGVALTLLGAQRKTRLVVCELGTSAPGELERLSLLVRPSRVIVTEIGQAHLSGLGSLTGVIRAKAEVFRGLIPGGTAFIHEAAPGRDELARAAREAGGEVALFGWERGDYRITACRRLRHGDLDLPAGQAPVGFRFRVQDPFGSEEELILALPGRHNVLNALGALAAARDLGLDWAAIRAGVRELTLPPRRFEVTRAAGVTVIDDSYNASQRSVMAALEEAEEMPTGDGGRRFLVLGDLLELGGFSEEIHRQIGKRAAESGRLAGLITVGPESRWAAEAARASAGGAGPQSGSLAVHTLDRVEDAAGLLEEILLPGDLVLFKASRAVGLERAVEETRRRLQASAAGAGAAAPAPGGARSAEERPAEGGRAACSTISTA